MIRYGYLVVLVFWLLVPQLVTAQEEIFLPLVTKGESMTIRGQHWYIVVPEQTTNYITNPSIEEATTGYSAHNSSAIAKSAESQIRGVYSLKVTPTSNTTGGVDYDQSLVAATWSISLDVKGVDGIPYTIEARDGGSVEASLNFTSDGNWARYALDSFTTVSTKTITVRVRKNSSSNTDPFYVDGLQAEQKTYATDYCDGDQDGCSWSLGAHESQSSRQKYYPAAGRAVNLNDYGFFVDVTDGLGIADIRITTSDNAQSDGTTFKSSTIQSRTTTIQGKFAVEKYAEDNSITLASDQQAKRTLHQIRSQLLALLYPGAYPTKQPVYFRYNGSGKMLQAGFFFNPSDQTGARLTVVLPNGLRLLAPDPYVEQVSRIFTETDVAGSIGTGASTAEGAASNHGGGGGENAAELTTQQTISGVAYVLQRTSDGEWINPEKGTGLNGEVNHIIQTCDGDYVFSGAFTTANGVTVNRIVRWDGSDYYDLDSGVDAVGFFVLSPSCTLYVAGPDEFGGVAAASPDVVGEYDFDADSWTLLQDLVGIEVMQSITVNPVTGYPVVVAGPIGDIRFVYLWNGSTWLEYTFGTGSNKAEYGIYGLDGLLYVTGRTGTSDTADPLFKQFDGSSFTILAVPSGINWLREMALGADGTIYAAGRKTQSSDEAVFAWNGTTWSQLGGWFNNRINQITVSPDGTVYATGDFTDIDGLTIPGRAAKYSGGAWANIDIELPGAGNIEAVYVATDGTLTIGFDTTGTATASEINAITNNGNAVTYPIVKYTGNGRLYELTNQETSDEIFFDYSLQTGEDVTIDLQPGIKSITSSFNGNLFSKSAVLPGSDFATFRLLPGSNNISNLIDDSGASGTIQWKNLFISFDG